MALQGLAVSDADRTLVFPMEFGIFESFDLEQELAENSWLTMPANSDIIFSTPADQRLGAAAASLGIDMNLISGQAGHA